MKQKLLIAVLVLAVIAAAGCKKEQPDIEGNWTIDLEQMIQQARSRGASSRDIQQIRKTFENVKMTVDSHRITLAIAGIQDKEVLEYKILSKQGQCVNLAINSSIGTHKYCVTTDHLEIHDPGAKLIVLYKKS